MNDPVATLREQGRRFLRPTIDGTGVPSLRTSKSPHLSKEGIIGCRIFGAGCGGEHGFGFRCHTVQFERCIFLLTQSVHICIVRL